MTFALIAGMAPNVFAEDLSGKATAQEAGTTTDRQSDAAGSAEKKTDAGLSDTSDPDEETSASKDNTDRSSDTGDSDQNSGKAEDAKAGVNSLDGKSATNIKIQYDEDTTIHYVTEDDGTKIILYCMNNELHWPHVTKTIQTVPEYTETSFEDFFTANNITGEAQVELKNELENILYAGYPYNGYGLYEIVDKIPAISEKDFDQILTPPQFLRDDFPDSIGNNTFTYEKRNDSAQKASLNSFLIAVGGYYHSSAKTPSGLTYQQLIQLPFYRAALCMVGFSGDPIESYSSVYLADYYVEQEQAYGGTRDAIWSLLKKAGLDDNQAPVTETALVKKLLDADSTNQIPTTQPNADEVSITGDQKFYYSTDDQKWHTGSLSLTAPNTYNTSFELSLPDGVTEESGKKQVKPGEIFSLVSSEKPSDSTEIMLSSTVPWMDPALKVYVADSTVTASDGKGFQNMIGAVIHQTPIKKTAELSVSKTDFTFTKVWDDGDNQDGKRPDPTLFAANLQLKANGVIMTGYEPAVTDNGDGTWKVTYQNLPGLARGSYTVTEGEVDSYTGNTGPVENGGSLTNVHTPETITVSGTKTWEDQNNQDGNRPESITVNLLADGTPVDRRTVQAGSDGTWTYQFTGLPKYQKGQAINYTVTEDAVDGYSTEISGYDITNRYTPGKTSVTVTKDWEDQNDQDGKRPDGVQVQLYADGKKSGDPVTLNEADNWTYTWTGLDEKSAGSAIRYTVQEVKVPDGYTASVSGSAGQGFVITNTHQPETIEVSGTKTWDDGNNQDGNRPESITVNLLADGVQKESAAVQADADGNWTYRFDNLPKYENGREIVYTVTEDAVSGYSTEISGYDITNRYTPGKTSVTVTKDWEDQNDQDGKRPDGVKVQLYADGTASGDPVTLNASGKWTYTWEGLAEMSAGKPIQYTVQEVTVPDGYSSSVSGNVRDGFTIINIHTPETIDVSGTKTWDDGNNQDGNRPGSITVNLLADGVQKESAAVQADADGNWTYRFDNLPKYENGREIVYNVTEDAVSGYSTEISGYDITNRYTPGKTSVTVTKDWEDQNDQDGKRPDGVKVQLYANGTASGDPVTLTASGKWTYTWEGLAEKSAGKAIQYTVQEVTVPDGYSSSVSGNVRDGFTIINIHTPETIDVSGTKTWDDGNNQAGARPGSITVNLLADGVQKESAAVQADADGKWTYSFTGLPKYQNGQAINYTVTEDSVDGYSTEISGYDITNRHTPGKTSVTVTKDWEDQNDQDGKRPDSVQVQLYAEGKKSGDPVTLNEADNWTYTWTGLDEKSAGSAIRYTVQEVKVPDGYTASVSGSAGQGFVITNTHQPETIEVSGTKTWDDGDNQDGKRPGSITVNLLADGVQKERAAVQADADGNWTYRFDNLPKYENGREIVYTVTEDAVSGYSTEISGYDITNRYTPGKTSVTVTKVWEDRNDPDGKRPDSVQVQLYADGKASGDPVKLTAKNNWTYTWSGLDEMSAGKAVEYTVSEVKIPDGYTSSITGSAKNGFTVINALEPTNPARNAAGKTGSSPRTGDGAHALLYGVVTVLALTAALLVSCRKRRRK